MLRARLTVSYLGSGYHGFAANPGVRTVAGDLTEAISKVVRAPVELTGAGRTDAGVHGWGQVISCDLPDGTDLADLAARVNKLCAPGISVRSAEWAAADFDARRSATSRTYRYHVWNDPAPNPLLAGLTWHVPRPIDLTAAREAVAPLIGEHDFTSFCRKPKVPEGQPQPSMVRIVRSIDVRRVDDTPMLRFEVTATSFCHQMVRSLVGTLVDVGLGRLCAADVTAALRARDRSTAGTVAPPDGLILWSVGYDGTRWDVAR